MKHQFKLLFVVAILILASLACSTDVLTGDSEPESDSSSAEREVLFQDDFSDPSSGWDTVSTEEGITDYENGTYRILVNTASSDYWANPGLNFKDTVIDVDATKAGGPDDNDFGVICRYQDVNNFYFFLISSDGFYAIAKSSDGEYVFLEPADEMSPTDAVLTGEATNHIQAKCVGSRLTLIVNGEVVAETEDTSYLEGDVGLMAGTFDEVGTDIRFDNFSVTKP